MTKLDSFLGQLETTNKPADIQGMIEALQNTYSVANVVYLALNLDGGPFAALTYTQDWMTRYQNKKYIRVDPVVKKATQQFHPLDWNRLDWSSRGSKAFLGDAIGAGVGNQGLSIPIRGRNGQFALFTLWLNGVNIRLKDFDTPEPRTNICGGSREVELAHRATNRLQELLNDNTWTIETFTMDGTGKRLLATIEINGEDVGDILIREGLARRWPDGEEFWCR